MAEVAPEVTIRDQGISRPVTQASPWGSSLTPAQVGIEQHLQIAGFSHLARCRPGKWGRLQPAQRGRQRSLLPIGPAAGCVAERSAQQSTGRFQSPTQRLGLMGIATRLHHRHPIRDRQGLFGDAWVTITPFCPAAGSAHRGARRAGAGARSTSRLESPRATTAQRLGARQGQGHPLSLAS